MARSYNSITILGYVGGDPEVRDVAGGRKVANFSVATSPPWDDTKTEWHRVTAWGKLAEIIEQYVSKGDRVMIEGRLQYSEWTDEAGNNRKSAEINADDMVMLGTSSSGRTTGQTSTPQREVPSEDELPF